jgi:hypothetical protein
MPAWLIGLATTLLAGSTASAWLWLVRRRNDELVAGLQSLSAMRWRDFSRMVLAAMEQRGLKVLAVEEGDSLEPRTTFPLTRNGERWLLSCKHGSAYRIGAAPVDELAASVRLSGAQGGILATEGYVEKAGREAAQTHGIDVVDGRNLWPEVKPLMEAGERHRIVGNAKARAKRHIGIAWLAAVTLGLLVGVAIASQRHQEADDTSTALAPTPPPAANAAKPVDAPSKAYTPLKEPTEEELEQQRQAVTRTLSHTPGIARGVWNSRLTLSVDRLTSEAEAWPIVCKEVERYPSLRTVRVQLNPPPGSDEPVRWRQCKTF